MSGNIQDKPQQSDWFEATMWLAATITTSVTAAGTALTTLALGVGTIGSAIILSERTGRNYGALPENFKQIALESDIALACSVVFCGVGMCVSSRMYAAQANFATKSFKHFAECL